MNFESISSCIVHTFNLYFSSDLTTNLWKQQFGNYKGGQYQYAGLAPGPAVSHKITNLFFDILCRR